MSSNLAFPTRYSIASFYFIFIFMFWFTHVVRLLGSSMQCRFISYAGVTGYDWSMNTVRLDLCESHSA